MLAPIKDSPDSSLTLKVMVFCEKEIVAERIINSKNRENFISAVFCKYALQNYKQSTWNCVENVRLL
jgi:hypothetical protein